MDPANLTLRAIGSRVLILAGLMLCGSALRADTIVYSNFGDNYAYDVCCGVNVTNNGKDLSVAIELPNLSADYLFTGIKFIAESGSPNADNSVSLGIFADNGGVPGATALETLTLNTQLSPFDATTQAPVLTLTSVTNPELFQGTRYWVVMDGPPGESLVWGQNSTQTSGFLETDGTPGNWQSPNSGTNGVFELDGVQVGSVSSSTPEPEAWWLMLGGLAAVAFAKARRQRNFDR